MDVIDKIGQGQIVPVLAITLGALVGIVAIISGCLHSSAKVRHDAELRKNMLDRGMSAAEVEVAMRGFGVSADSQTSVEEALYYDGELAKSLAIKEYSPETIDSVVRAFRSLPANEKETVSLSIQSMLDEDVGDEQLVAAVRALCRAPIPKPEFTSSELAANLPLEMRH